MSGGERFHPRTEAVLTRFIPTCSYVFINAGHFLNEKGARGPQRGAVRPWAWFHATVVAYATDFDSTSAMTAKCFTCRNGPAEPGIYEDDTKPGDAHGVA
jgi:hypothetical protein